MSVTVTIDGALARVVINNPPVNATGQAVRAGLRDALVRTEAEGVAAVILSCAGRTFVAGADVREFGKPPVEPHLPDVLNAIEQSDLIWIAAIHGTALGGGLELALACDYRIADPGAKMGLPEVNLGLIPGAGGTVRLPRLIAPEMALEMISGGKPVGAARALEIGLVDAIAEDDLAGAANAFAQKVMQKDRPVPLSQRTPAAPDTEVWAKILDGLKTTARGQRSPIAAGEAVTRALTLSADEAFAAERAAFLELKDSVQSAALRHIFFAERGVGKAPQAEGGTARALSRIGVIGGGTMGSGIAAACLLAGYAVTMIEREAEPLQAGLDRVKGILDGSKKRGKLTEASHAETLARFGGSVEYDALSGADLVIEAVFEDMDVKKAVFAQLDAVVRDDVVLASNTSYLDVDELAAATKIPGRVIGLHFFSPAHVMKLLEVIVPKSASADAEATGLSLGKRLGKISVPAGVCDGFIGNRIMSAYRREADYMIEDGALPHEIDTAMRIFGFPMGIFQMQDMAGLDIAWAMRKRRAATRPASERYVEIADRLCEAGRFGRKTGLGWYDYRDDSKGAVDPEVTALIKSESERQGITRKLFSGDEIMARILSVMQAEGRAILDEGIAASADAIDVVMVNGYGFPRWRGGPMYMATAGGC